MLMLFVSHEAHEPAELRDASTGIRFLLDHPCLDLEPLRERVDALKLCLALVRRVECVGHENVFGNRPLVILQSKENLIEFIDGEAEFHGARWIVDARVEQLQGFVHFLIHGACRYLAKFVSFSESKRGLDIVRIPLHDASGDGESRILLESIRVVFLHMH